MAQLNHFQLRCQASIENKASDKRLAFKQHILPDVIEPNELQIKISIGDYLFCVYPDGADVGGVGVDERFEIYDYRSLDDLETRYLKFVHELLDLL